MAKRVNKNMVAALTAFGFVVMTAAGVLMILQLRDVDPRSFVESAERHAAKGEWIEASMYYQKAYKVSKEEKHLVDVGQMLYNAGDESRARGVWSNALTQDPQLVPAMEKLLTHSYEVVKRFPGPTTWRLTLEAANTLLEQRDQDAFALFCKGQALIGLRQERPENLEEGFKILRRATEIDPDNVEYVLTLAMAAATADQPEDSEELFHRLVVANTTPGRNAFRVRALYGRHLANSSAEAEAQGEADEAKLLREQAMGYFDEAIALAGDDPADQAAARVFLAQSLFTMKVAPVLADPEGNAETVSDSVEEAKELLGEAIDLDPDGFEQYLALAAMYRGLGRPTDAVAVCEQRLQRDIDRKGLKGLDRKKGLFRVLLYATRECLSATTDLEADSPEREALLDKAQQFVVDAKGEFPSRGPALQLEAKILLARGKDLDALAKFEEADRAFQVPNIENKTYLATLYLMQDQIGAAREVIEVAVQNPRAGPRVWRTYANVLLKTNQPTQAAEAAQKALEFKPDDEDSLLLLADCFDRLGRHDLVRVTLNRLPGSGASDPLLQVQVLVSEERYEEALAVLTPIAEADLGNVDLANRMIRLYRGLGREDQAQAWLERARAANPNSPYLERMALAFEEELTPEERDQQLLAIISKNPDEYRRSVHLAGYHSRRKEYDQAVAHLARAEQLLDEKGTPAALEEFRARGDGALRELTDQHFVILLSQEKWEQAASLAARVAERNLDGVDGLTFYGRLELVQGNTERATETLRQALDKRPNNSQILVILGQAYLDLGRREQARSAFERSVAVNPNNAQAHKGLAMLAKDRQDIEAYRAHFGECIRLIPDDNWVREEREGLEKLARPEAYIEKLVAKRKENPEDVQTIVELAELYTRTGQMQEVEECYATALKLAPDSLSLARRVAEFYRKQGRRDKALEILESALAAVSEPRQQSGAYFLLAEHFMAEGNIERADAAYLAAVDKDEGLELVLNLGRHFFKTGRPGIALDWLEKSVALAKQAGDSRVQAIENMRVEALVNLKEYDRAAREIERLLAEYSLVGNAVLILRAEIEAARGEIAQSVESLSLFLEGRPDNTVALFRRAKYLALQGKWSLAIKDLELLKARDADALELRPRRWLAQAYERTGRLDQASAELKNLLDENPNDANLAEQLIQMYVARKDYDQAGRVAQRMLASAADKARWMMRRGQITAELAVAKDDETDKRRLLDRALDDLRRAAEMSGYAPGVVTSLLAVCRTFERPDPGIELYEQMPAGPERRDAMVVSGYAGLLAKKGLAAKAVEHYRMAAHTLRGQAGAALYLQAVARDAVDAFGPERAIELFRSPPDDQGLVRTNQTLLAIMLSVTEHYSEAATLFRQLVQAPEDDAEEAGLSLLFGAAADQADDVQQARQCYEQVVKLEPTNWVAYNNLAYLLCEELQQCAEALPYAERAVALNDDPKVEDTLATVFIGLGRYPQAVGILVKAIQRDPTFVVGYMHLGAAYRHLGRFDEAQEALNEAQRLIDTAEPDLYADEAAKIKQMLDRVRAKDSSP